VRNLEYGGNLEEFTILLGSIGKCLLPRQGVSLPVLGQDVGDLHHVSQRFDIGRVELVELLDEVHDLSQFPCKPIELFTTQAESRQFGNLFSNLAT